MHDAITTATDDSIEQPSETVVRLVADREDTSPTDLVPLYSAIDPESLDSLFHARDRDGQHVPESVTFRYYGYEILVESGGDVTLTSVDDER